MNYYLQKTQTIRIENTDNIYIPENNGEFSKLICKMIHDLTNGESKLIGMSENFDVRIEKSDNPNYRKVIRIYKIIRETIVEAIPENKDKTKVE